MLSFKIVIVILFGALLLALLRAVRYAIVANRSFENYAQEISLHRKWASISFWLMVAAVLVTETMVRFNGGLQNKKFILIHLGFAIPFTVLLGILRFWITGVRRSRTHRPLAYACMVFYLGTFITGVILILRV